MVPFQRNRFDKTKVAQIFVVLLLLGVVVLVGPWVRDLVAGVFTRVPTEYAVLSRSVLVSRLAAAETEVQRTKYQSLLYQDTLQKVQALEKELGLRPREAYGAARVLAAPPKTQYDTLLIDSGAVDGVVVGDVASVEGIAVGIVTDVSEHSALVELFSSPGSQHDATVGALEGTIVLHGVGAGTLEATVPGDMEIERGDTVRSVRSGAVFAVVLSTARREIDTEQLISVVLPVTPGSIHTVSLTHQQ